MIIFFCTTLMIKYMFPMNLMYKSVSFYRDIYFGYLFIIFIFSNTRYEFSLLNDTFSILFWEKPNLFQYYFVTKNYFCFNITHATVVQILFCEKKCKRKITVKNSLTNNCNTTVDPANMIFQYIFTQKFSVFLVFLDKEKVYQM